jgi:hypothetical protein
MDVKTSFALASGATGGVQVGEKKVGDGLQIPAWTFPLLIVLAFLAAIVWLLRK